MSYSDSDNDSDNDNSDDKKFVGEPPFASFCSEEHDPPDIVENIQTLIAHMRILEAEFMPQLHKWQELAAVCGAKIKNIKDERYMRPICELRTKIQREQADKLDLALASCGGVFAITDYNKAHELPENDTRVTVAAFSLIVPDNGPYFVKSWIDRFAIHTLKMPETDDAINMAACGLGDARGFAVARAALMRGDPWWVKCKCRCTCEKDNMVHATFMSNSKVVLRVRQTYFLVDVVHEKVWVLVWIVRAAPLPIEGSIIGSVCRLDSVFGAIVGSTIASVVQRFPWGSPHENVTCYH